MIFLALWLMQAKYPDGCEILGTNHKWLGGIYIEQSYFSIIQIVIRSFIISVRYGYCSELRYTMIKEQGTGKNKSIMERDLIVASWLFLHPTGGLRSEIDAVIWRN